MIEPSPDIVGRVSRLLGRTTEDWRAVVGGYTPAARFILRSGDRRVFVKVATTPVTARMLRREAMAYQSIKQPFVPEFIAWEDHCELPLLIIEDLADAVWPPPWDRGRVDSVVAAIARMHSTSADLAAFADVHTESWSGWADVSADPTAFLRLGVASEAWLRQSLAALLDAEANCPTHGGAVTHFDLRSDNTCIAQSGVKFIDWSGACLGNAALDLGSWLPSLACEGGPNPEEIIGCAPEVAARVSGYFAARAGLPDIADAPFVRRVQREQLSTALPWAVRALGLPTIT